jgi:hypothetical protein
MAYELSLIDRLRGIHSALDDALGDTDVTHIEDDNEMRDRYPVQWAAEKLAAVICELLPPEEDPSGQRREPSEVGWMGDIGGNPFGPFDR